MERSEFLKAKIKALIAESKYEEPEDDDEEDEEDEDEDEVKEQADGEAEGGMVKAQLKSIISDAQKLHDSIEEGDDLPAWVQNKITLAHHNVEAATEYMTSDIQEEVEQVDEATPYYNKPSWIKKMSAVAKQDRLAREKKEKEAAALAQVKKAKAEIIREKINMKKAEMGDVIKDFYKSKAPQFKGKTKEKRRQMAIAAKLSAMRKRGSME